SVGKLHERGVTAARDNLMNVQYAWHPTRKHLSWTERTLLRGRSNGDREDNQGGEGCDGAFHVRHRITCPGRRAFGSCMAGQTNHAEERRLVPTGLLEDSWRGGRRSGRIGVQLH